MKLKRKKNKEDYSNKMRAKRINMRGENGGWKKPVELDYRRDRH
jgi:hypothetical protein